MSSLATTALPSSARSKLLIPPSASSSVVCPLFTSYATTLCCADLRRSASHDRNGSLLDITSTGPAVRLANIVCACLRHSGVRSEYTRRDPSDVQRRSLFSVTYVPAGALTVALLPVARFQITGSKVAPLNWR